MNPSIQHCNFGWLHSPPFPPACCHGLILRTESGIVLVDTGIGTEDIQDPNGRIGQAVVQEAGFQFLPEVTAIRQIESMGLNPKDVKDIVLTHADPDHAGGLADFPWATVHIAEEELQNLEAKNPRYSHNQFSHSVKWNPISKNNETIFGIPARSVPITSKLEIHLVPLFGHTAGHCGVSICHEEQKILFVGDAYYLKDELTVEDHPVNGLAELRADDNSLRLESLQTIKTLSQQFPELAIFGTHDTGELPESVPSFESFQAKPT